MIAASRAILFAHHLSRLRSSLTRVLRLLSCALQVPVALVGKEFLPVDPRAVKALEITGHYGAVRAANVVGSMQFGRMASRGLEPSEVGMSVVAADERVIVVSTPLSSWGPAAGERGPVSRVGFKPPRPTCLNWS